MKWTDIFAIAMVVFACAFVPLAFIVLRRNSYVLAVRVAFIHAPDFPRSYLALPSYEAMLYAPEHWRRWTRADWQEWLEKRANA